ncbi:UvrD-helicase domain-containing protein [Thermopolyspora sp. NPDC052614]|uniref:UvrD-helicase domain-containing protein n=1 Tax=Thermopolyspora sp. NPDC052614 TaxID=3155682 RepID=UPI0034451D15
MPRLAISPEFPRELSALAHAVRADVLVAIRRFLVGDPEAPVPERVRHARDPRTVTLRLAEGRRAVAVRLGDLYWLVTVLQDAEAWEYARRHRFTVNAAIGVVESWDAEALEAIEPALRRSAASTDRRLLAHICDGDLLHLGIDLRLLRLVRLMATEAHLTAAEPLIPESQYAPLAALAAGGGMAEAWRALDARRAVLAESVDPDDLAAALERSPDQAAFVSGPPALERLLTAPEWCTFLDPPQHRLAHRDGYPYPVLVTGGAGTGKTLVALHRAAHLARRATGGVLFVTFSQGLAADLSARLDVLIEDEVVRKRVDVVNIDRLAHRIVGEAEGRPPKLASPGDLAELWRQAAEACATGHGPAFLMREWEQVVLAQNLRDLDEYLAASRVGRGVELDADERRAVWACVQDFLERLRATGRRTLLQLAAEASLLLGRTTGDLLEGGGPRREPYRHLIVDEAQDLHPAQWRLLRAAVPPAPDDVFVVGDPHQRVFDTHVALAEVGIPARESRLRVCYRLPQEILSWAVRLRGGGPADGLVEGSIGLDGLRSTRNGERPAVLRYVSPEAELAGLVNQVREWLADGVPAESVAVAARSGELVRAARTALRAAGLDVKVTTLHGMKGLELSRVAVIGVADGVVPAPEALTPVEEDAAARAHDMQRERGLLYTACTRTSELLYVSYTGRASPFLPP